MNQFTLRQDRDKPWDLDDPSRKWPGIIDLHKEDFCSKCIESLSDLTMTAAAEAFWAIPLRCGECRTRLVRGVPFFNQDRTLQTSDESLRRWTVWLTKSRKVVNEACWCARSSSGGEDLITPQGEIKWESRVGKALDWIRWCKSSHGPCEQPALSSDVRPSRLIEVYAEGTNKCIRVIQTPPIDGKIDYTALSHCWGASCVRFKLTKSTMSRFECGIPLTELPRTFRDAVHVTLSLGLRYIWIDALCIIQEEAGDDKLGIQDWENEASKMGSIYANAYVTLAAADAKDSAGSLFLDIPAQNVFRFGNYILARRRASPSSVHPRDSVLSKRGWILQELVLSPRVIHFSGNQMFWQCKESRHVSEDNSLPVCGPVGEHRTISTILRSPAYPAQPDWDDPSKVWSSWAVEFARMKLTRRTDRLAALAGITRYFQSVTNWTPLAGMWQEDLFEGLLWQSISLPEQVLNERQSRETKEAYITTLGLPSWSWLSSRGPLNQGWHQDFRDIKWEVQFEQCIMTWTGQELTSTISRAEIHGVGLLTDTILWHMVAPGWDSRAIKPRHDKAQDEPDARIAWIMLDDETVIFPMSEDTMEVTCLLFGSVLRRNNLSMLEMEEAVLVVRKATDRAHNSDNDDAYERLGAGIIRYLCKDGNQLALEDSSFFTDEIPRNFILI